MPALAWTAHLQNSPKEKAEFEDSLRHSTEVLQRLKTILEEKKVLLDRSENTLASYENPGWSHKQAHLNGKRAALEEIAQLLTI